MATLEDRLEAVGRRPAGFDYLRIALSLAVVLTHTVTVAYGTAFHVRFWGGELRPFHALVLPMFFALSGFLVAGSLERCRTLVSFLGLRVLRIMPALAVETTLSALLLGPLLTSAPLGAYFASSTFHSYFLNMLGDVHYGLPGVFEHNPTAGVVNGQLWTLPVELACYVVLSVFALAALTRRAKLFLVATSAVTLALFAFYAGFGHGPHEIVVNGSALLLSFLWGVAISLLKAEIPWSAPLAFAAAGLALAGLAIPGGDFLAAAPAAYLTVYLGLLNPPRLPLVFGGDYSYGLFLYGYPIQQAVVAVAGPMSWWENFAISLPVIAVWAVLSWRFVERPALSLRGRLVALEDGVIRLSGRLPIGRAIHIGGLQPGSSRTPS